jgi:peptide/nickel transport system ATP-binding protein
MESVLTLHNLSTCFDSRDGCVNAVCNVNLAIKKGKVLGLIGETGCGKSVLGQSILRLLPSNAHISGQILFEGQNILDLSKRDIRRIRGRKIAYISQNPQEALNPVLTNGTQIMESVKLNQGLDSRMCKEVSIRLLKALNFHNPEQCMEHYPIHLSGGMKQRVLAAMGMSGSPALLIADEPTKGLDALIRGQVVATIMKFIESTGSAALIITHDLKFASTVCDEIAVMYAGEIIESGNADELFQNPKHPYLKALIASQPFKGMQVLEGSPCSLINLPSGCRFYERCGKADRECGLKHPGLTVFDGTHEVRCAQLD